MCLCAAAPQVLEANPTDKASSMFVERCKEYIADPPVEDWDGVYRPKSK